ncbi:hypothetical protein I302_108022 [Kwoniella bestiolae CBS 10118]|uniref:EKC/KEOPS complex subunit GON7 n=1 Tax=Kwoniella bestiolae CBS 10118 TaxID=1296100 RepID=A0A1B9FWW9_9TREE|nr:hypothetical protein I302_07612 [Kwoniella bestiolae CBS 10118]OCF23258.1 hypothetical protein I302_07612 [Kwoniella bestiolae CBS 10118]
MTSKTIQLTYTLHPPSSISPPLDASSSPIPSSSTLTFAVPPTPTNSSAISLPPKITQLTSDTSKYYESLTISLRSLQQNLNDTLTKYKDAVGDLEKQKEDFGKVGHGMGRATVMSLAVNGDFKDQREGYQKEESESGSEEDSESD